MFYDLHIHSCLSPCADDDMTPNNIVNMALLNGLDLISVTDHNALDHQKVIKELCDRVSIRYIYGVEVQSQEDVHGLAYFKTYSMVKNFAAYIDEHLIKIPNDSRYFGHQYIRDINDQIIKEKTALLISSLDVSINEIALKVKLIGGVFVLAHIDGRENAILNNLGFIPPDLEYVGLEIPRKEDIPKYQSMYPQCKYFLHSSDAHQLIDIHERVMEMSEAEYQKLFT